MLNKQLKMYHTNDINLIIQTWETYEQYNTFKDITFRYVFSSVYKSSLEQVLLTYFSRIASAVKMHAERKFL